MRVLYVSGTYCPAYGGAEISANTALKELQRTGLVDSLVLTDKKYTGGQNGYGTYEGIRLYGTDHASRATTLENLLKEFKPDCILTQLLWSDVALLLAKKNRVPSILRVCKTPFDLNITSGSVYAPTTIIAVSQSVEEYVRTTHHRVSQVIHPMIDKKSVCGKIIDHFRKKYITMFNPIEKKGGRIFRLICEALPEKQFAIVPGWNMLKTQTMEFDPVLIQRMCESLGVRYYGQKPNAICFADLPNVVMLHPTTHVNEIYDQTRILCVPSIWEEPFGRVATEGFMNTIPVLGSNVGGLKEQIRRGGILVEDYMNPASWVSHLLQLENQTYYTAVARRGNEYAEKEYDLRKIILRLYQTLTETTMVYCG